MLHSIDQFLFAKYIYVQVMCTLVEISVQYMYQIICTLFITMSKSFRINGLCIGNSIQCILIVKLCNRVQGSKKSVLLCSVRWVCSRCQRLSSLSSIRKSSGSFTINNVRSNGKNRSGWLGITVGMDVFQFIHEGGKQISCNLICSVIIITIAWEITLNLEISGNSILITDSFYLRILNSRQRIYYM